MLINWPKKYCCSLTILMILIISDGFCQTNELLNLSIMHRKSGNTLETYDSLQSDSIIHYYKSGFNPYFRVYSFKILKKDVAIDWVEIESWIDKEKKSHKIQRLTTLNNRVQFVDQYLNKEETRVVLNIYYTKESSSEQFNFRINVELDQSFD